MGNTLSLQYVCTVPCNAGWGMCVSSKHGLIIVSGFDNRLYVYSLADGSPIRSIGGKGEGKGQFEYYIGGLCLAPDGDGVLVAEKWNNRVQEVRISDGAWVRFVGVGVLAEPEYVDANADIVVVSEPNYDRVSALSWRDGSVLARFGGRGGDPGQLYCPSGIKLLADGGGLIVADSCNHRLCLFRTSGEFVRAVGSKRQGLHCPYDVLECVSDGSLIVANTWDHQLLKLSSTGEVVGTYGTADGEFDDPTTLAALPDGGLVVLETRGARAQVFRGFALRHAWISTCVLLATREWHVECDTAKRGRVVDA
jgi:hypothetical protein